MEIGEDHYLNKVMTATEVDVLQGMLNAIWIPKLISYKATIEDYQEVSAKSLTYDVYFVHSHASHTRNPTSCLKFPW